MKFLKKYGFFTLIFLILTWFMSNDLSCLGTLDPICIANFLIKYIVFMVLMIVYDRFIKPKIFGKKNNN